MGRFLQRLACSESFFSSISLEILPTPNPHQLRPFRTNGWDLFEKVLDLNPGQETAGEGMYDPLADDAGNKPPSPYPDDTDDAVDSISSTHMDAPGASSSTADQSTTLVSAAAGKRKAIDPIEVEDYPPSVPLQPSRSAASASSVPTSSVKSQTDSGLGGSAKKKRTSKIGEAAASMKSSCAQGPSAATPNFNDIRLQQFNSMSQNLSTMLTKNSKLQNQDPFAIAAEKASATAMSGVLELDASETVDLLQALRKDPEGVSFFNGAGQDLEIQKRYALSLIEEYQEERAARRARNQMNHVG